MEKQMRCVRCQKEIKKSENYMEIQEWNNQRLIDNFQIHKTCWTLMMNTKDGARAAISMIPYLKGAMQQMGVNPVVEVR